MSTKKHVYTELPPSEHHVSHGKSVRTNTRNSAFPRALDDDDDLTEEERASCLILIVLLLSFGTYYSDVCGSSL